MTQTRSLPPLGRHAVCAPECLDQLALALPEGAEALLRIVVADAPDTDVGGPGVPEHVTRVQVVATFQQR